MKLKSQINNNNYKTTFISYRQINNVGSDNVVVNASYFGWAVTYTRYRTNQETRNDLSYRVLVAVNVVVAGYGESSDMLMGRKLCCRNLNAVKVNEKESLSYVNLFLLFQIYTRCKYFREWGLCLLCETLTLRKCRIQAFFRIPILVRKTAGGLISFLIVGT